MVIRYPLYGGPAPRNAPHHRGQLSCHCEQSPPSLQASPVIGGYLAASLRAGPVIASGAKQSSVKALSIWIASPLRDSQ
ncbi:MAG: hypothetical protein LBT00_13475 [Spirochaetaceae bacterium]|nr:hypothetical protein [Spirochaetaceae bacterium]